MQDQEQREFHLSSEIVLSKIEHLEYKLPKQEAFLADLRAQKFSAMQVNTVSQPDIVTTDRQAFLKYLRVSNIRGVMYAYSYYTESDLDRWFDLSAADKPFFHYVKKSVPGHYTHTAFGSVYFPPREIDGEPQESDFDQYLLYSKYMRLALDLSYPTRLDIYALQDGKLLCCRLVDPWLERLELPNAQMFKAMFIGKGAECPTNGMITFRFRYIPDGEDPKAEQEPLEELTESAKYRRDADDTKKAAAADEAASTTPPVLSEINEAPENSDDARDAAEEAIRQEVEAEYSREPVVSSPKPRGPIKPGRIRSAKSKNDAENPDENK